MTAHKIQELCQLAHAGEHAQAAECLRKPGYVDSELRKQLDWHQLLARAPRQDIHLLIDALRVKGFPRPRFNRKFWGFFWSLRNDLFKRADPRPLTGFTHWYTRNDDTWVLEALIRKAIERVVPATVPPERRAAGWRALVESFLVLLEPRTGSASESASQMLFHLAQRQGAREAVEVLMARGADIDYTTDQAVPPRFTAYTWALRDEAWEENAKVMLRWAAPQQLRGLDGERKDGTSLRDVHERLLMERREELAAASQAHVVTRARQKPRPAL